MPQWTGVLWETEVIIQSRSPAALRALMKRRTYPHPFLPLASTATRRSKCPSSWRCTVSTSLRTCRVLTRLCNHFEQNACRNTLSYWPRNPKDFMTNIRTPHVAAIEQDSGLKIQSNQNTSKTPKEKRKQFFERSSLKVYENHNDKTYCKFLDADNVAISN